MTNNEITGYSVVERKHGETAYNRLEGDNTDFRLGDTIERMGIIFTVSNGGSYEILEFEGNGKVSKMESDIKRHNNLVREFDQMVNGKIN